MALHWPTFFTRLGSAIVFSAIMMAGLLWNEWAFLVLVSLIQVLCLRDFFRLTKKISPDMLWPRWLQGGLQILCLYWLFISFFKLNDVKYLFPLLLPVPILILTVATLHKRNLWKAGVNAMAGILYIVLPMLLLMYMRQVSIIIPLALVLMIWMNDTMAYLVGSFIGKTPFSSISPKKTWEGTIGGMVLTVGGAAVWGYYSPYYKMFDWITLALIVAVAGTAGDLLESKIKRMANVKDSGMLMPGHGGALDRFDSLIVATPFAFAYVYTFMPYLPLTIF